MKKLWTQDTVNHQGKYWQLEDVHPHIFPVQDPHPPIWIGAHAIPGVERAAKYGDGFVCPPETPKHEVAAALQDRAGRLRRPWQGVRPAAAAPQHHGRRHPRGGDRRVRPGRQGPLPHLRAEGPRRLHPRAAGEGVRGGGRRARGHRHAGRRRRPARRPRDHAPGRPADGAPAVAHDGRRRDDRDHRAHGPGHRAGAEGHRADPAHPGGVPGGPGHERRDPLLHRSEAGLRRTRRPGRSPTCCGTGPQQRPDALCLDCPEEQFTLTYAEALGRRRGGGSAFYADGAAQGDRVVLMAANSSRFVRTWFGAALGGLVEVPINTDYEGEFLRTRSARRGPVRRRRRRLRRALGRERRACAGSSRGSGSSTPARASATRPSALLRATAGRAEPWESCSSRRDSATLPVPGRRTSARSSSPPARPAPPRAWRCPTPSCTSSPRSSSR